MHSDVAETSGQCDRSCCVQGAALFRRSGQYCKGKIVVFFYVAIIIEEWWGNKNPVFSLKFPAYYITALEISCVICRCICYFNLKKKKLRHLLLYLVLQHLLYSISAAGPPMCCGSTNEGADRGRETL